MEPTFKFELRASLAQLLWVCIQKAPLPREATNELAEAISKAIEDQNKIFAAEVAAKMNGQDDHQAPTH